MPDRFTRADLLGKSTYLLLDITYAGRLFRLSTTELDVTSTEHGALHYHGDVQELTTSEGIELFGDASGGGSGVVVEAVFPVDVAELVARGHDLAAGYGELSEWIEGTDYEDRRVVLVGRVSEPEYGAEHEPVRFSLREEVYEDYALIPEAAAKVDEHTWPDYFADLADEELDAPYPVIIGQPGRVSRRSSGWVSGSMGQWAWHTSTLNGSGHATEQKLIIAGHRVLATTVYVTTDAIAQAPAVSSPRVKVQHTTDALGREVAFIDAAYNWPTTPETYSSGSVYGIGHSSLDPSLQPGVAEYSPVYVGWYDVDNPSYGGMVGPDGNTLRGAGDVLEWALSQTTIRIDRGRLAAAKPLLSAFKIDAVVDTRVSPWAWVRDNLLPILPVSIVTGPLGVYPIVWRYDAVANDAVAHLDLDADPTLERVGSVRYDSAGLANRFSLKWAFNYRTKSYTYTANLGAGYDADDPDTRASLHCAVSQRRMRREGLSGITLFDGIYERSIESPVIYAETTADAVLGWMALAFTLPRRTVDILAGPEWGWLERGMVVQLDVDELFITAQLCLLREIEIADSGARVLRLLLLEEPVRDAREV